nr:unnamed protein product [Digitaria exilis]
MFLRRRLLSTAAAAARGPPPIRVDVTESAGRGVFATRPVPAGELLHSAQPLVCHPSPSLLNEVCYSCLRRKPGEGRVSSGGSYFCSDACRDHAKGFHDVEKNADWSSFDDHCSSRGLKYPYMAKRLACMVISGAANADCLNILQPARLHQGTLIEVVAAYLPITPISLSFDPNTHIVWLENVDAKLKALRDIEEGEELRICYIDTSMDVNARQKILADGFGFECQCLRCLSGD